MRNQKTPLTDFGGQPLVINLAAAAAENSSFRTALWTGEHLQITLMSIPPGEEIGIEMHPNLDQLLRIESGCAVVLMGHSKSTLNYKRKINRSFAVTVPSGTWHNIINTGRTPLLISSVYAPPQHHFGTVHKTKADAEKDEH